MRVPIKIDKVLRMEESYNECLAGHLDLSPASAATRGRMDEPREMDYPTG